MTNIPPVSDATRSHLVLAKTRLRAAYAALADAASSTPELTVVANLANDVDETCHEIDLLLSPVEGD